MKKSGTHPCADGVAPGGINEHLHVSEHDERASEPVDLYVTAQKKKISLI